MTFLCSLRSGKGANSNTQSCSNGVWDRTERIQFPNHQAQLKRRSASAPRRMGLESCRKIELAMSTALPKAAWQPDYHRNLQAQISEYHDKDLFKQMATVHIDIQKAREREKSARKQERPLLSPKKPQKVFFWQELLQ